ncbi:hypothetical protein [Nonomuraea gerenzanensis]|uniref:Uncharacterized protein n=1 Tax=Nonomuraea gerenzanensis TaxID=93944 RepID=A0A1M4DVJ2_9ACTN|nr:hypothetical protein [Nonomuraea gerenzanensis]UBU12958.1 hypothetical protein LCN96_53425 [Nonomuraea gerenzanensis]SBO90597.1 hypothetical protein BN4615_P111 [Nonomuraea gerenzanensis]
MTNLDLSSWERWRAGGKKPPNGWTAAFLDHWILGKAIDAYWSNRLTAG